MRCYHETINKYFFDLCAIFDIPSTSIVAETKTATTDDGETVVYDDEAVNGGIDLSIPESEKDPAADSWPASIVLKIPFIMQKNGSSALASSEMLLKTIGLDVSHRELSSLLSVETDPAMLDDVFNDLAEGSPYQFQWSYHDVITLENLKYRVLEALNYGNPILVKTAEFSGDIYIRGHNVGYSLHHYGLIGDYFENGNIVTYVDPAQGRFHGFMSDQSLTINQISNAAGGQGYVW